MKKIDIEVFFQKNKSQDCGPVCVQMVLNHFGYFKKLTEIIAGMSYQPGGTYIYDNGLVALKEGLQVELVTANPLLFTQENRKEMKKKGALITHLKKIEKKKPKHSVPLSLFRSFIDNAGKATIEIPELEHIRKALDKDKLVIAFLYGQALGKNEGGFHSIVVTGYKKGHVHINNPGKRSRQGWFTVEDFLYALHSSTCVDVDNGSLLIIGK
jgi:hypothetical protein